jgi:hypothetical protein
MASFQGMYNDLRSHRSGGSLSRAPFIILQEPTSLPLETIQEAGEGDSVSHGGRHPSSVSHHMETIPPLSVPSTTEAIPPPTETQNDEPSVEGNIEIIKDSTFHTSQSNLSRTRKKERLGKRLNVSLLALNKNFSNPLSISYKLGRAKSSPATFFSKRHNARKLQASHAAEPNGRDETVEERTTTLEDTRDDDHNKPPAAEEESTVDEIHYIVQRGGGSSLDFLRCDDNSNSIHCAKKPIVRRASLFANAGLFKTRLPRPPESTTATDEIHFIIKRESSSVPVDFPKNDPAAVREIIASSIASHKNTSSLKHTTVPNGLLQQRAAPGEAQVQSATTPFDDASKRSQSPKVDDASKLSQSPTESCLQIVAIGQSPINLNWGAVLRQRWRCLKRFGKKKKSVQNDCQRKSSSGMSKRSSFADSCSQLSANYPYIGLDGASIVSNLTSVTGVTGRYYGERNGLPIALYRGDACQETLAGTLDDANQCFWHMMTVDQLLLLRDDDAGSDSLMATSVVSVMEDEDTTTQPNSAVEGSIQPTGKYEKALVNAWRRTSRKFRPSPVFHLLKKLDSGSIVSGGATKRKDSVVSRTSFSPLQLIEAFDDDGTRAVPSRFWAVMNAVGGEEDEEESLTNTTTEKSRQYHRGKRATWAEAAGDNVFSIFGLR